LGRIPTNPDQIRHRHRRAWSHPNQRYTGVRTHQFVAVNEQPTERWDGILSILREGFRSEKARPGFPGMLQLFEQFPKRLLRAASGRREEEPQDQSHRRHGLNA
jgi:hypothetical protein